LIILTEKEVEEYRTLLLSLARSVGNLPAVKVCRDPNDDCVIATRTRCFQVMETTPPELLNTWVSRWANLIDVEVIPVLTSTEFWAKTQLE
jgi:hypothetical protein